MQNILLTGFDPFDEEDINPASEIIRELSEEEIKNYKMNTVEVPTERYRSVKIIEQKIDELNPEIIISLGQAGGRTAISIERIAINIDDYRIEDNNGNQPIDEKINLDGPAAYFSTLPVKAIVKELHYNGVPAEISNTAGTFVCNHVMYGVLDYVKRKGLNINSGFIHVPYLPTQVVNKAGKASMSIETMHKAIKISIESAIEYKNEDINYMAGKTH